MKNPWPISMSKTIVFPAGAGGNWLVHLIWCLENNISADVVKINYHISRRNPSLGLSHDHDNTDRNSKFFNGHALFNIYLNNMIKCCKEDPQFDVMNIMDKFELMANEASSKLFFYGKKIDLDWDDLFKNKNKFVENLYKMLDDLNINYVKNNVMVIEAIDSYKKTCVDPALIFNNFDDELWLGWCNGVMKHEFSDWQLINSVQEAKDKFYSNRNYFYDYTVNKFIKIN